MPADPREPGRSELLKDVTQERIWRYAAKKGDDGATSIEKLYVAKGSGQKVV